MHKGKPGMLLLNRRVGERIVIGENIVITVGRVFRGRVQIGVEAPKSIRILREELLTDNNSHQTHK